MTQLPTHPVFIISRTDAIGDVVLTLPLAGALKEKFPDSKIIFLGRTYTQPVIRLSRNVDEFINWDDLKMLNPAEMAARLKSFSADAILHVFPSQQIASAARRAKIPQRIGTSHRLFHWWTCNHLIDFSRKNSELHEAQLNFKLLEPLGITDIPSLKKIPALYGLKIPESKINFNSLLQSEKFNLILHPRSSGSAREWGLENFSQLIDLLPEKEFQIFVTGTTADAGSMEKFLPKHSSRIKNICGKFSLEEFIQFIQTADGLIAASTGPLHLAAASGKPALGIYPPMKPIHPGRWAPLGEQAAYLVKNKTCSECKNGSSCRCMVEITPEQVAAVVAGWRKNKFKIS